VRDEFIQGILELADQATWTVFISSHDIREVERLADWIGIIDKGRLHMAAPVAQVLQRFRLVEIAFADEPPVTEPAGDWVGFERATRSLRFVHRDWTPEAEADVRGRFSGASTLTASAMTLESVFIALARSFRSTGEEAR